MGSTLSKGYEFYPSSLKILLPLFIVLSTTTLLLNSRFSAPANAPLARGNYPIVGAVKFFSKRYEFHTRTAKESENGIFSFYVGRNLVIGISGPVARKTFFEAQELDSAKGYKKLLGLGPEGPSNGVDGKDERAYINNRVMRVLKGNVFEILSPALVEITSNKIAELAQDTDNEGMVTFDPFEHLYNIVFHLT